MLDTVKNILIITLKLLFCSFFTLFLTVGTGVVYTGKFDWQICLYLALSVLILAGMWLAFFVKNKKLRIYYLLLFMIFILTSKYLPSVKHQYDLDICMDTGVCDGVFPPKKGPSAFDSDYCVEDGDCAEGREVSTKYGKIIINKENCLKYSWTWYKKYSMCKLDTRDFIK